MTGDPCKVYRARVDRLDADLEDPALSERLAAGWSVAATLVVEDDGVAYVLLLLSPPRVRSWADRLTVIVPLLGALAGALIGGLL